MDKRYQVFVSSTYNDLREERRQVIQTLLEMDCIPAGMEMFPAADEEQFEFIKRVINDCDYYVVIVGGRYGTLTAEDISYTEKEYDYAVERGLPVVALIHENPEQLAQKTDPNPEAMAKLQAFRAKLATGRMVKYWSKPDEVAGHVAVAMQKTIKLFPAVGWVRADKVATVEVLQDINDLRKRNDELERTVRELSPAMDNLADLGDIFMVTGFDELYASGLPWTVEMTWGGIFNLVASRLLAHMNEEWVRGELTRGAFRLSKRRSKSSKPTLDSDCFQTIKVQFMAMGLITVDHLQTVSKTMAYFWRLTPHGQDVMIQLRAVRKVADTDVTAAVERLLADDRPDRGKE